MKEYLEKYIKENYKILKITCICFIIGLVVGMILYLFVSDGIKNEFTMTLKNTLELSKSSNFENINIIKNGVISNAILLFMIYFCSITLAAPVLISMITFFKSFSIGIYIPIIFNIFGISNGLLVLLLLLIIPNILYIPAFIFSVTNAIKFHYLLFEESETSMIFKCLKEFIFVLISFSMMILSIVVEQLLTTSVIGIYGAL
ncbi:MAG: stage II sporulation protein M [Clostridia bacterium]|nr:stage II sporulation protein M [Clostridia bacterium]